MQVLQISLVPSSDDKPIAIEGEFRRKMPAPELDMEVAAKHWSQGQILVIFLFIEVGDA